MLKFLRQVFRVCRKTSSVRSAFSADEQERLSQGGDLIVKLLDNLRVDEFERLALDKKPRTYREALAFIESVVKNFEQETQKRKKKVQSNKKKQKAKQEFWSKI